MGNVIGTSFATAGFSYDANISPNNQSFSGAVLAVTNRNPAGLPGTGTLINLTVTGTATVNQLQAGTATFAFLDVTGTATVNALQVTTATIAAENVSTATIAQLVAGTGTFSQLTASGTATFGSIKGFGATAGGLVDATPDTGSFTATLTGCTTAPTCTVVWARIGNLVILWIPNNNAVSNSTSCSFTGLPTELQPARSQNSLGAIVFDAGVAVQGGIEFSAGSGTMTLLKNAGGGTGVTATFTNSATAKGWNTGVVSYILN